MPYVGLRNEGATCYLNSMLQSLFHNHHFRDLIYCIEVNAVEMEISFVEALQRIFYEMEQYSTNIRTMELIERFDWEEMTPGEQQDIEEFSSRLFDQLETYVRFSPIHTELCTLLSGELETFVVAGRKNCGAAVSETFWDIQLSIKENDDISEALKISLEPIDLEEYTFIFQFDDNLLMQTTHHLSLFSFQLQTYGQNKTRYQICSV